VGRDGRRGGARRGARHAAGGAPARPVLTVVKVGGGLGRGAGDDALRALCGVLGELGARHPLIVVPGGASFADAVRDHDRRFGLPATTSHHMAVLAMEQFGWLLGDLIPRAVRCADLARARELGAGHTTVLLPAGLPIDELPASWQVTSDSIAAWVAGQVRADRLVLVKEVDGLFAQWPVQGEPLARLTVAELAALRPGGADAYLPTVLEQAAFETWVIGGREPGRLVELLDRGTTVGTRIA
jgi:5-(aminomethyl)-3-furanmethanol phosphate kinase